MIDLSMIEKEKKEGSCRGSRIVNALGINSNQTAAHCAGDQYICRPLVSRRETICFLALSSEPSRREGKPLAQELSLICPLSDSFIARLFFSERTFLMTTHFLLNILYFLFGKIDRVLELDLLDKLSISQH